MTQDKRQDEIKDQNATATSFVESVVGQTHNPDVLSCLANLSNDEVFTPPEVVNQMLDALPQKLFRDPKTTFLDPACKSGVFLREIAKRLIRGLENAIPDLSERLDHIYKKQLFGIAITELTSLVARRTLYCSLRADSEYSIANFDTHEGNIRFHPTDHQWVGGKCAICGAAEAEFGKKARRENKDNHAYEFIHHKNPQEIFNVKFDVIVGNPPYQLNDGGAQASASPLYDKFVEQAKKLNPRYLTMIIPARWYSGGKGLDKFRNIMINDRRFQELHDFPDTTDCFPGLNIRGGVCYFLWNSNHNDVCHIINHKGAIIIDEDYRSLHEEGCETFIRYNVAIKILRKVQTYKEATFEHLVSSRKPFGLATNFKEFTHTQTAENKVRLYRFGENGYVSRDNIIRNHSWIDQYKVFVPYASPGQDEYPHLILSKPIIGDPGTACTETYLLIGPFSSEKEALNASTYMRTRFFRFMLLLKKSTQHITKKVYEYVPEQNLSEEWNDEMLYDKYGLNTHEREFISTLVREL